MTESVLDEALDRLRDSGPERDGWLSNHAPMAVEALASNGHGHRVHRWIDGYADRLEDRPRGIARIAPGEWRDPLGDPVRTGDWLDLFDRELRAAPWREVLLRWWPRLLPGIAAGATHGVIRVGHAVRALRTAETPARVTELGQGLAYWAARWQPLAPAGAGPYRPADPRVALDAVPRVSDQRFGIRHRLAQLADLPRWPEAAGEIPGEDTATAAARLAAVVRAAAERHGSHGHGNPVMMVHAVTAPNAVLRVLPVLPQTMWPAGLAAAWAATAAVTAAYAPADPRPLPPPRPDRTVADLADRAAAVSDPHAIKYADAVADVLAAGPDPALLASALRSVDELAD
jgi:Questin oxidase-like